MDSKASMRDYIKQLSNMTSMAHNAVGAMYELTNLLAYSTITTNVLINALLKLMVEKGVYDFKLTDEDISQNSNDLDLTIESNLEDVPHLKISVLFPDEVKE